MSKEPVYMDLNKYLNRQDFESDKCEEFFKKIEPQLKMIENIAKQIKPVLREYKDVYGLDFEKNLLDEINDRIVLSVTD